MSTTTLQWGPNEEFTISGFELETMVNLLKERLNNPEAQAIIKEYDTLVRLTNIIKKGVEEGKVKETSLEDHQTL